MASKLTKENILKDISTLHCSLNLGLSENPEKDEELLHLRVKKLVKEHCKFKLVRANNEQIPYTEEETGLPIELMESKKETGRKQVLDYHPYIYLDEWIPLSFGIERKSCQDFHGTLYKGNNYKRFKREIATCKKDLIFKGDMYVFVESPYENWVTHYPIVSRYTSDMIKSMIVSKENALAAIMAKGVKVMFWPSRAKSARFIKTLCYQHAVETYANWLNL